MNFENIIQVTQASLTLLKNSDPVSNSNFELNVLLNKMVKKRKKSKRRVWSFPKSNHYFAEVWYSYEDDRFFKKYRMSKQTFNYLCTELKDDFGKSDTQLRNCIPIEKRVAVALHFLKSNCDSDTIGDLYGIGRSTAAQILTDFCDATINKLENVLIKCPTGDELDTAVKEILVKWGFPGCFGALDGSHLPIITPSQDPLDYFNYKKYHSIVLMAAVDASYKFIMTNVGQTGRNADSTVFSRTTMYKKLNNKSLLRPDQNYHLISDAAFPLHEWLMKPYIDNDNTPSFQKHSNYRLSRARMTLENAFGRLKGRWRILLKRMDFNVENCVKIARACTILHNLCELHQHEYLTEWEDEPHSPCEIYAQPGTRSHNSNNRAGESKRNAIATSLLPL